MKKATITITQELALNIVKSGLYDAFKTANTSYLPFQMYIMEKEGRKITEIETYAKSDLIEQGQEQTIKKVQKAFERLMYNKDYPKLLEIFYTEFSNRSWYQLAAEMNLTEIESML